MKGGSTRRKITLKHWTYGETQNLDGNVLVTKRLPRQGRGHRPLKGNLSARQLPQGNTYEISLHVGDLRLSRRRDFANLLPES